MKKLSPVMVKIVRWTGWFLFILIGLFLFTGYGITGRYGLSAVLSENEALTLHRLFHLPLIVLWLAHSLCAIYLAMIRWGWIKP
ncbi:MAG: hypothetical protein N2487_00900 [Verrucomicrobiae bacterium]|nr:hypothetical protein [Verrucomicrobiae bacterium]